MSRFEGPQGIVTNGLILNLDAGDPDSYTRSQPPFVEVLVVAGGGGGGARHAGGGGAGGVIYNNAYQLTNAAALTVTVGSGGVGTFNNYPGFLASGGVGSNSVFGSLTAIGGGGGGSYNSGQPGTTGGSGGGNINTTQIPGTPGQGFNGGGSNSNGYPYNHGGGGGASEPGQNGQVDKAGNGGNGQVYAISGTSTYYAGGGAGGSHPLHGTPAVGGLGGGGNEGPNNGTINTGGGGGGGTLNIGGGDGSGGNGGSGIVIVRYPGLPAAHGGTITYLNGYTIHTFTTSGTFTPYLWNDVSGNGNNGTLVNGTNFIPNIQGGYFSFDGVDDYANLTTVTSFNSNQPHTYSAWIYPTGFRTYNWIIDNGGGSTGTSLIVNGSAKVGFFFNGGQSVVTSTSTITSNTWFNVVTVYSGLSVNFYINGAFNNTTSVSSFLAGTVPASIGRWSAASTHYFPGRISQTSIYNRALSATEIAQNFNAQRSRFGLGWPSAEAILELFPNASNGLYPIQPLGSSQSQMIYCDMENGGWMLVSSNDASDGTIPGGIGRNNVNYILSRPTVLGTPDPNSDYIIGSIIDDMNFTQVRIVAFGRNSINGTYSFPNNLGENITATWTLTTTGASRFTEKVVRANVTIGGNSTLSNNSAYFILDAVKNDIGYDANVNQSTIGGAGVASATGDPSSGCYLGHGTSEGSYEGWYNGSNSAANSQGYTTWVK